MKKIEKSSDGLYRYHNRVVIPRPANVLIKAMLFEYHDNVSHPNYRRLMFSLLKHYWWVKMTLDCKLYCQHSVNCNRPNPIEEVELLCNPWKFLNTLGNFSEFITSRTFLKVVYMFTQVILLWFVTLLSKMAHFVPCHKEITAEESTYLFISIFYRLHVW